MTSDDAMERIEGFHCVIFYARMKHPAAQTLPYAGMGGRPYRVQNASQEACRLMGMLRGACSPDGNAAGGMQPGGEQCAGDILPEYCRGSVPLSHKFGREE